MNNFLLSTFYFLFNNSENSNLQLLVKTALFDNQLENGSTWGNLCDNVDECFCVLSLVLSVQMTS